MRERKTTPNDAMRLFGLRVLEERTRLHLSQSKIASLSGLTQHGISTIETGMRDPRLTTICRLAETLGIDPREFFDPLIHNLDREIYERAKAKA